MKYIIKKDSDLYSCLNDEQKELRYDIVRRRTTSSGKTTYYKISALMSDGIVYVENALPNEIEEVELTFGEEVTEQIEKELRSIFN